MRVQETMLKTLAMVLKHGPQILWHVSCQKGPFSWIWVLWLLYHQHTVEMNVCHFSDPDFKKAAASTSCLPRCEETRAVWRGHMWLSWLTPASVNPQTCAVSRPKVMTVPSQWVTPAPKSSQALWNGDQPSLRCSVEFLIYSLEAQHNGCFTPCILG